jgi:putative ABC transport system permease protein
VIDESSTNEIAAMANVKAVSQVAEFPGSVQIGGGSGLALIDIVDSNYTALSGDVPDIGTGIGKTPGVVVSSQALRLLNIPADNSAIGKEISITAFYPSADGQSTYNVPSKEPVPIIGVEKSGSEPTVTVLNQVFPTPQPFYKELYIEAQNNAVFNDLRSSIANKGFVISAHIDLVRQAQQVTNIITIILAVFGVAALTVSAIGMFNTMIIGFLERTYEVGVMKAIGATDRDVEKLFLMESLIMGLAGGFLGILLGVGLGELFNFIVSTISTHLGGQRFALFVSPFWFILLVVGVSALIGLAAGFIPAHRASLLSPREAFLRK